MSNSVAIGLLVTLLLLDYLVAIPLILYSWRQYQRYAHVMPVKKRSPKVVRALLICVIVQLGISDTLGCIYPTGTRLNWNHSKLMIVEYFDNIIYCYCSYLFLFIIVFRYWINYYK